MYLGNKIAALRWKVAIFVARTGLLPLLICSLPCVLLVLWLGVMMPHTSIQQNTLNKIQFQLRVPLLIDKKQPKLQNQVTPSEYQLVGLVFDRLNQSGLAVEASRYQLDSNISKPALILDIPIRGNYMPLVESLETLARTLPLEIEKITLHRATPAESQLNVNLRLRLLKEVP